MIWKPNTHQLETIAVLGHARAPVAKIATALGITEAEFKAWAGRLAATRALAPAEPRRPRIVAERSFNGGK